MILQSIETTTLQRHLIYEALAVFIYVNLSAKQFPQEKNIQYTLQQELRKAKGLMITAGMCQAPAPQI